MNSPTRRELLRRRRIRRTFQEMREFQALRRVAKEHGLQVLPVENPRGRSISSSRIRINGHVCGFRYSCRAFEKGGRKYWRGANRLSRDSKFLIVRVDGKRGNPYRFFIYSKRQLRYFPKMLYFPAQGRSSYHGMRPKYDVFDYEDRWDLIPPPRP